MVLPAKSGIVPISAFCVEQSRWQPRGDESGDHFTLTEMAGGFTLRQAIAGVASQIVVWDEVEASQDKLTVALPNNVRSEVSPTSLPLALESEAVQESTKPYIDNLSALGHRWNDVIGFAFAINDEIKSADVYSSNVMFKRFWPRLLKAAAIEAVATPETKRTPSALSIETVGAFLVNSELGAETVSEVNART
jgi:hypothetical protein